MSVNYSIPEEFTDLHVQRLKDFRESFQETKDEKFKQFAKEKKLAFIKLIKIIFNYNNM